MFISERERETERQTQIPKQAPGSAVSSEPNAGLEPTNREIMTWAEVGRLTNWATQAPPQIHFYFCIFVYQGQASALKKSKYSVAAGYSVQ